MGGHHWYAFAIVAICQSSCTRPTPQTSSESCVPNTLHVCACADGQSGLARCTERGTTGGSCDCGNHAGSQAAQTQAAAGHVGVRSAAQTKSNDRAVPQPAGAGQAAGPAAKGGAVAGRGVTAQGASAPHEAGASSLATDAGLSAAVSSSAFSDGGQAGPLIIEPSDPASYIFDPTQVRTYNIVVASADLARIDAMPAAEMLVPATLEFEGQTYGPYKVRYKGSQGSFVYPCTSDSGSGAKLGKCSLKLDFNDTDPDARFYGLKKLNFHSMNADVSMLRDRLGYQMFREMGVAAPRAVHARVLVNGELQGLFIAVEQIDGRFTRARFVEGGKGNLYKEVWPLHADADPYVKALKSNRDNPAVQTMLDFKQAVDTSADAAARFFDRDYLMRYLAVDRVIINDDGALHFWCNEPAGQGNNPGSFGNHNYYWYEESASPRLWLVPWDLDHSFDGNPAVHLDREWTQRAECVCTNQSVAGMDRPASCDPLVADFIGWLPDYEAQVDAFLQGPFQKSHVDDLISRWSEQIRGAVVESAGIQLAPDERAWADAVSQLVAKCDGARAHRGYAY